MTTEMAFVLALLVLSFVCFARQWLPLDVTALCVLVCLVLAGILTSAEALAGFSHPAVVGVGALFVVTEGLLRTGSLTFAARHLAALGGKNRTLGVVALLVSVAAVSAFLNNTPVVAMFIPVVLTLCRRLSLPPSRLLIPLSFAAILGGTCTLVGTSTNVMVASLAAEHPNLRRLGLFEFAPVGLVLAGVGIAYLAVAYRWLLPQRETITTITERSQRRSEEYVTELVIRSGGPLEGRLVGESPLGAGSPIRAVQLIRGEEILWPPFESVTLRGGDAVVVSGKIEDLVQLSRQEGLRPLGEILDAQSVSVSPRRAALAEILVLPNSSYVQMKLDQARFRRRFGVTVLALQRHGLHLREKISRIPLKVGDVLLVQGSEDNLARVAAEEGLLLLPGTVDLPLSPARIPLAAGILALVLCALFLKLVPMAVAALGGAALMVLSGCVSASRLYEVVPWRVLVLIAGMVTLGTALQKTGAADWLAGELLAALRGSDPRLLPAAILVLTTLLTECVSNTAVAAIMVPVALRVSALSGVSPYPLVMAVAFGASSSFLTPIGYQTNTLVYAAGGYRFGDFFRVGLPLVLLVWVAGGLLIPIFWPVGG